MNQPLPSIESRIAQATQALNGGDHTKAAAITQELMTRDPHHAGVRHLAGLVDYTARRHADAVVHFSEAVRLTPRNYQYLSNLGEALRRSGDAARALDTFEKALLVKPEFLKAHLGLANSLKDLERHEEAMARYRLILAINPGFAEAYHYLGLLVMEKESPSQAIPLLRKALALRPRYEEARHGLATALERNGEWEEALTLFQEVARNNPKNISVHNNIGNILKSLGRMDEAIAHFQQAMDLDPQHAASYYNLSRSRLGQEESEEELQRMEELLRESRLQAEQKVSLHFALGKIYDDLGRYQEAFQHFQKANDQDKRGTPFHPESQGLLVNLLMNQCNRSFFNQRHRMGCESDLPIFIVGMPRSGTTLVEQILASHPQVFGAGELPKIGELFHSLPASLGASGPPVDMLSQIDAVTACRLGDNYVSHLRTLSGGKGYTRVTDKMPGNFMHLGFISLILPNARIIILRREPLDTCLSCYFQYFTQVMPFSKNLTHLGRYYREFDRITAHWRKVIPSQVMEVQYEEVVANQEEMSRRIIEFAGLPWDPACLEFHKTERPVKTASQWQVRQPMYNTSVARYRNYEPYISPLVEALGSVPNGLSRREPGEGMP